MKPISSNSSFKIVIGPKYSLEVQSVNFRKISKMFKTLPSSSFLQERPKTIETHQDFQEFTSSIDFLQDSSKIQPFDQDFFSNFQYLSDFGPIHQELVS